MNRVMLALLAVPLLAAAPPPAAGGDAIASVQQALDDPRTEARFGQIVQALSDAVLNLRVGEIQAAAEGRPATAAERKLTVRDVARRDDPQFESKLKRQLAQSVPALRQSMRALSASLPAIAKSFEDAGAAIERATTNLPDPTYPKR